MDYGRTYFNYKDSPVKYGPLRQKEVTDQRLLDQVEEKARSRIESQFSSEKVFQSFLIKVPSLANLLFAQFVFYIQLANNELYYLLELTWHNGEVQFWPIN